MRILENLVATEGNRDIMVAGEEPNTYVYTATGEVTSLEVGKTYTYSITFQGKKGGYANILVDAAYDTPPLRVEHTGDVQTVHYTVVCINETARGVYLANHKNNNYVVGESIRLISISVHEGTQGSDIYVPPHAELTPEQIATLPPYGEYKEIQTF